MIRWFLISIALVLAIGFYIRDKNLVLNIHDTYFVMSYWYLAIFISKILGVVVVLLFIKSKFK
ncbi:conserved hypothetical protein [Tenacibaculum aestuarii]